MSILRDRALDSINNPRLLRIKEKTFWWTFQVIHVPGLRQQAADALSKRVSPSLIYSLQINPKWDNTMVESGLVSDMMAKIQAVTLAANPMTKDTLQVMTWSRLLKATQEDAVMVRLAEAIKRGFPDSQHDVSHDLREYYR